MEESRDNRSIEECKSGINYNHSDRSWSALNKSDDDFYLKSGHIYECTLYKYQAVPMFLDYDKLMKVFITELKDGRMIKKFEYLSHGFDGKNQHVQNQDKNQDG